MSPKPNELGKVLTDLGFAPMRDFELQQEPDGSVTISHWLSDKPCPFPELLGKPA